jgi:hypothetical protein
MFTAKGDTPGPLSADAPHVTEQPATSFAVGFSSEPPLSLPIPGSVTPVAPAPPIAAAPQVAAAPEAGVERPILPVESLLLRFRMITPDQLAEAMKEEALSGKTVATIVVEKGWVSEADMARLAAPDPTPAPAAVAAPAPVTPQVRAPEPVAAPAPVEPVPAPVAAPVPVPVAEAVAAPAATGVRFQVLAHLANGERIEIAIADDADSARAAAIQAVQQLRESNEWPLLAGRYVRPEAIVSVDVAALLS